jgi:hypothetical protein
MPERQIVKMVFGSHVYGTNTPNSDQDFKSVFLPNAEDILLQRVVKTSRNKSTGPQNAKNAPGDVDIEEFSLSGYLKLLCEGQTVAVDMLFVPKQFITQDSETWRLIRLYQTEFISKAIAPFIGYCRQQANKYGIKGSRMAAAKAAAETLRTLAAVPDARLSSFMPFLTVLAEEHPDHITFEDKKHPAGSVVRHLSVCGRLAPETLRVDRAAEMYERLWLDYGDRARQAMNNDGIDWKALMHARRICDQAIELLGTGHITFPRPNADELLEIRLGERPYAEVAQEIELGMEYLETAMMQSQLREKPNKELAERIVLDAYRQQVRDLE